MTAALGVGDDEPEMREEEVLACAFAAWYERFQSVTFKSEVIPLPESFVTFLEADGINLGPRQGRTRSDSDSSGWGDGDASDCGDTVAKFDFPQLEEQINAAIERLGGKVLPKLNWSAPKDAAWVNCGLKCFNAREVFTMLKASDFVSHDLGHSFDHCGTSRRRPDQFTLVLRRWHEIYESNEFRCFVSDGRLLAMSQRNTSVFFEHLVQQDEAEALRGAVVGFFEQHVRRDFLLGRYAFDVHVGASPRRRVRLLDFSPWGPTTDACLFDWPELASMAISAAAEGDMHCPELRVVRDESEQRLCKAERYSQMPLELAQLSAGEGLEELIRKADAVLREKRKDGDVA